MRKSLFTTELWTSLLLVVACLVIPAHPNFKASVITAVLSSFMLARGLYKKWRGLTDSAIWTAEFWAILVNQVVLVCLLSEHKCSPELVVSLMGAAQIVYNVTRGLTKSVRPRSHTVVI